MIDLLCQTSLSDRDMLQLAAEVGVQSQASPYGMCGKKVKQGQSDILTLGLSPVSSIQPVLHAVSFLYGRRYTNGAIDSVGKQRT